MFPYANVKSFLFSSPVGLGDVGTLGGELPQSFWEPHHFSAICFLEPFSEC